MRSNTPSTNKFTIVSMPLDEMPVSLCAYLSTL